MFVDVKNFQSLHVSVPPLTSSLPSSDFIGIERGTKLSTIFRSQFVMFVMDGSVKSYACVFCFCCALSLDQNFKYFKTIHLLNLQVRQDINKGHPSRWLKA